MLGVRRFCNSETEDNDALPLVAVWRAEWCYIGPRIGLRPLNCLTQRVNAYQPRAQPWESAGFHLTQRVNAYQPRVQPWGWEHGYASGTRMVGMEARRFGGWGVT